MCPQTRVFTSSYIHVDSAQSTIDESTKDSEIYSGASQAQQGDGEGNQWLVPKEKPSGTDTRDPQTEFAYDKTGTGSEFTSKSIHSETHLLPDETK